MTDLSKLTVLEANKGLKNKDFTSEELTKACIKNIEANRNLNAFVTEALDLALESAKKSDEKIQKGEVGKIEGIPFALKDLFCTKGIRTTSASRILENFIPPYESTVSQKLKDQGSVLVGKTNMDEFACGSTSTTSYFGPVISPFKASDNDEDLVPGGSSGGSAVAVSVGMCLGSTGTDTGGSIRQPAAFTNLVGVKPTYGRVSRYGIIPLASSFDQAGILSKTVRDSALLTEIISGYDKKDSTSMNKQVPNWLENLSSDIKGKKVGIVKEFINVKGVHPEIVEAFSKTVQLLKDKGCEVVEVSLPNVKYSAALYMIIAYNELASNLARYDGVRYTRRTNKELSSLYDLYAKTRSEGFGENIKKRILLGYYSSSSENYEKYLLRSLKIRRLLVNDMQNAFKQVDILLTPTTPNLPFSVEKAVKGELEDAISSNYLNDLFAIPVNLCGLPGISVPAGLSKNGLPMGMHLIANRFDEQTMFDFALAVEEN